jgi:hypothetical protein
MVKRCCIGSFLIVFFVIGYIFASASVVIEKDIAKVMVLPYGDAKSLGLVKKGDQFKIIAKKGDWYNIEFRTTIGWIYQGNVKIINPQQSPLPVVATKPVPPPSPQPKNIKEPQKPQPNMVDLPPATIDANGDQSGSGFISLPATGSPVKVDTSIKFFEITESSSSILATVSPQAPILGMARSGDCFEIIYTGQAWLKIKYKSGSGWVDRRSGKIVNNPTLRKNLPGIILFILFAGGIIFLVIFTIIIISLAMKNKTIRKITVKKDMLLIAHADKMIQHSLSDSNTSISKCFSEVGFKVTFASDMEHARSMLLHYLPDVIVIDWQLAPDIIRQMESVLTTNKTSIEQILMIFYNITDISTTPKSNKIPHAQFLGVAFSDREIFKLVTPLIIAGGETKSIRKSVESSALGGEIKEGNLLEVMQFIEIGRKTGCLYVVLEKPFGLIYFEQGRLTSASSPEKQGRDAVFEVLNLKNGHFHFVLDKTTPEKNVTMSTLEILMEWTKIEDEAHRN